MQTVPIPPPSLGWAEMERMEGRPCRSFLKCRLRGTVSVDLSLQCQEVPGGLCIQQGHQSRRLAPTTASSTFGGALHPSTWSPGELQPRCWRRSPWRGKAVLRATEDLSDLCWQPSLIKITQRPGSLGKGCGEMEEGGSGLRIRRHLSQMAPAHPHPS